MTSSIRPRVILAVAFAAQALATGTTFGSFSLFLRPVSEAFDASLAQVSLGISLITVMLGVTGILVGPWLDRGAIRRSMLLGAGVLALCFAVASRAVALWQLALVCLATGAAVPLLGPLTSAALVGRVFRERRGRALGIVNMGAPTGGMLLSLLAGAALAAGGWRLALALFAGLIAGVALPAIWLGVPVRLPGGEVGGAPGGAPAPAPLPATHPAPAVGVAAAAPPPGPVRGARATIARQGDFWAAALCFAIGVGCANGWGSQLASYVADLGGSTRLAALAVSAGAGSGVLGTLLLGSLADRVPPQRILAGVVALQIAGFGLLRLAPPLPVVILLAALIGLCGGGYLASYPALVAQRFGAGSLGTALGLTNVCLMFFGMSLPPLLGALREAQGAYTGALLLLMTLLAGALLSISRFRGAPPAPAMAGADRAS